MKRCSKCKKKKRKRKKPFKDRCGKIIISTLLLLFMIILLLIFILCVLLLIRLLNYVLPDDLQTLVAIIVTAIVTIIKRCE